MIDKIQSLLKESGCEGEVVIVDVKLNHDTFQPTMLVQTNVALYSIDLVLGDTVTIMEELTRNEV